jgi:cytoskeletal protein CcmA (bactofilin family)
MFSSKNKDNAPAPQPMMAAAPAAPPKRARALSAPSIISADMVINGTLNSAGDIQVDGRVEGDVRSVGLVIGDKAEIHGEVLAEDVTVRGKVVGRIRARKVLLAATSHVEGDILHEAFAVESGAFFEGNCRHSDNPLADNALSSDESRKLPPLHRSATASSPQPATPAALFAPFNPVTT